MYVYPRPLARKLVCKLGSPRQRLGVLLLYATGIYDERSYQKTGLKCGCNADEMDIAA